VTRLRPATAQFVYDVFIVHAAADEPFVQGYLLARLGLAPERVLRLQTLPLGERIAEQIERGVRSSRVTIVVLSLACMDDPWAALGEQLAAHARIARRAHGRLLPLLLEDCALSDHVQMLVPLDFRDSSREAWEAEVERLRAYLERPAQPEPELPCPYPGMRPFTEGDAGRFFGRNTELDRIVRRLRRGEREIYVIGASGSGKSSLLAAGLLPRLTRRVDGLPRFHVASFRPGERPLDRLAAALEGPLTAPDRVGALLARHAPAASLLLVIDQLEELFAIAGHDARRGFLEALRVLRADPRCVLVFALRADFYGSLMDSSLWTDRQGRISRIDLGPPHSDSLRAAIEHPARGLGVHVQAELVSRLLDDVADEPGALPLLQEALRQLWRKRRHRLLALADYHAMSDGTRTGLAFAVKEHADDVLGALTASRKLLAARIMLRLVNFGEGRADTRRQQPRSALHSEGDAPAELDAVLQHLVDDRLVTVTGDDGRGDVRVDLAHEVLIQAWPSFAGWIRTWRAPEQQRRELEAAAAAWRARGSGDGGLLDADEIAAARSWRARAIDALGYTADLAALLAASEVARADASRREREQRNELDRVLARSSQLHQELGRELVVKAQRPLEALSYLVEARQAMEASGEPPGTSLRMLFAAATRNLPVAPPLEHQGAVVSAAFSPDGSRVLTASADQTARLWCAATGCALPLPLEHRGAVVSAAFSPDGARIVTASCDWTAQIWDAATREPIGAPLRHHNAVEAAAFRLDGRRVITAGRDRTARIWDASTGLQLVSMTHQAPVLCAAFGPDGARVVTGGEDGIAQVWDSITGEPRSTPLEHRGAVVTVVFDVTGARVVTASDDETARIWRAATGQPVTPRLPHGDRVTGAAFSPDGTRVITAGDDRTARIWNAATGQPLAPPLRHRDRVTSAAFAFDGARVVTASADKTARIWDAATGEPLSPPLAHQGGVVSAAFSLDGARVVTASEDRTARIWDAITDTLRVPPLRHRQAVKSAVFSPDGRRVVTAASITPRACGTPQPANRWQVPSSTRPRSPAPRSAPTAASSSPPARAAARGSGSSSRRSR
jgi:WD40 repeat protein